MVVALHRGRGRRVASLSGLSHRARSCHVVLGVVASHRADKPNHQLAAATRPLVTHRLRGRRHRWAISTNPSVSHKPAPPPPNPLLPLPNPGMKSSSLTPPCATHVVGGVSPPPAVPLPVPAPATEAELSKPDAASVVLVLWLAIRVVVWACSNRLGTDSGKDGGCVAGSLAHPEAGHGVI